MLFFIDFLISSLPKFRLSNYRYKKLKILLYRLLWLEQFNLIQGVGAKTVQIVRQATTTQNQIKLLQP